jgi:hypothetical protein
VGPTGEPTSLDEHCVRIFGQAKCGALARSQNVSATFVHALAAGGYQPTLYGRVHAGGALDGFPGDINAFPWGNPTHTWTRAADILRPVQNQSVEFFAPMVSSVPTHFPN